MSLHHVRHCLLRARKFAPVLPAVCILIYLSIYSDVFSHLTRVSPYHQYQGQHRQEETYRYENLTTTSRAETAQDRTVEDRTAQDRTVEDRTAQDRTVEERRARVDEVCDKRSVPDSQQDTKSRFLLVRSLAVAMCYVPKAGCTFWKRVFLAIQNNKTDIFKLTKNQAHSLPIDTLGRIPQFDAAYAFLSKATRVMFVRDPYSRLYSGYVDKFYLGDFWASMGKAIIKRVRLKPSADALSCGHDLTFGEFLTYALKVARQEHSVGGDEHWFPITKLCHPCTFNYHIIGKQETFSSDRDYIVDKLGIRSLIEDQPISPEVVARDAMKQTIDMSWGKVSRCISRREIAGRMWRSYIDQGYIHHSHSFPANRVTNNTSKEEFLALAMEAYLIKTPTSEERQKQRREAMVNAYSTISPETLTQIQDLFRLDFDMFNYPLRPDDLFRP